jgi:hypothetical protein
MPRRSENSGTVCAYQGRFHRTLGRVLNDLGQVVQKKFLLGTNQAAAELANRRLENLWKSVVEEHADADRFIRTIGARLGDVNLIDGHRLHSSRRRVDNGPVWRAESLAIAEAVRKGLQQIEVAVGDDAERPDAYVERIDILRRQYPVIAFVPASSHLYAAGQQEMVEEARHVAEEAHDRVQTLSRLAKAPLPVLNGQTLFQAIDAYAKFAMQKNQKEFGVKEAEGARRLKAAHVDIPLSQFGISTMEAIAAYWAGRPPSKKTGRSIALSTVTNQLKTTRRFVRWLHRSDAFDWSRPIDAEEALQVRVAGLRNPKEISALKDGVAVWTIDELATLYQYATDRERLWLLLGLNCGFTQAEICTLQNDEILLTPRGSVIKRIRHKSQVYGEFALWPETVAGISWFTTWLRGKPAAATKADLLMITGLGGNYARQAMANAWNTLIERIRVDHADFRHLPFKSLRKTAGQLIRDRTDGEISAVFLCHGRAVAGDNLADVYTNRPFAKVSAALAVVREDLQPVLKAAPDAFTNKPGSSPNISRAKIEKIQKLYSSGLSVAEISAQTVLHPETVRRWIGRSGNMNQPSKIA